MPKISWKNFQSKHKVNVTQRELYGRTAEYQVVFVEYYVVFVATIELSDSLARLMAY